MTSPTMSFASRRGWFALRRRLVVVGSLAASTFAATAIAPPPAFAATVNAVHVRTINLFQLPTPSPDPAGIAWDAVAGRFIVSDSEVEEMSIYRGVNIYELNLQGSLTHTGDVTTPNPAPNASNEPTGAALDPSSGYLFLSDDQANKVTTISPGLDGFYGTPDDAVIASLDTNGIGSTDSEDVAFDPVSRDLFVADGMGNQVYRVSAGPNGLFDGVGDVVSSWDTAGFGAVNTEGLGYDPARDTLLVVDASTKKIYETTKVGTLLNTIDLTQDAALVPKHPEDVAMAPKLANPTLSNYYLVARGVDNDSNPNENDGKMYEFSAVLPPLGTQNQPPTAMAGPDETVTLPGGVSLVGSESDDGLPNPPGTLSRTWSQQSGPGIASFTAPTSLMTTVTFSAPGTYVLRLTVSDSALQGVDDLSVTASVAGSASIDVPVVASSDDAEESTSGAVGLSSSALELTYKTSDQKVGLRFVGAAIPQGATIQTAYIQFRAKRVDSSPATLTIRGQDADYPGTFTAGAFNISNRLSAATTASAVWTPDPWTIPGEQGSNQRTSDLSAVIQEIVSRSDWDPGDALVLLITGDGSTGRRRAQSFNGGTAPTLHIEYT